MALEFRHEGIVMRVDGDVLEIFRAGGGSHRVLLAWLAVSVQPAIKGRLLIKFASTPGDAPLYEVTQKAKGIPVFVGEKLIRTEEESLYRQFFIQVAQLCGRHVVP